MAETDTAVSFYTHGTGASKALHSWRYLGKAAQAYHCLGCDLRVTKGDLKGATDA